LKSIVINEVIKVAKKNVSPDDFSDHQRQGGIVVLVNEGYKERIKKDY
jgi:hypothetical protein